VLSIDADGSKVRSSPEESKKMDAIGQEGPLGKGRDGRRIISQTNLSYLVQASIISLCPWRREH